MILCKNKNEIFQNFIYLNGGWVYYKKCPLCLMVEKNDGSNYEDFYGNHEDLKHNEHGKVCITMEKYSADQDSRIEDDYEFNYDLERMQQAVDSETVYLPKGLKEKGEILNWLLNYDNEGNK